MDDELDFRIDWERMVVVFDCGYTTDIVDIYDEDGDYTLEPEDAEVITVRVPEAGYMNIYLDAYYGAELFDPEPGN